MNASDLVRRHVLQNQTSLVQFLFENLIDIHESISNATVSIAEYLADLSEKDLWETINYAYNEEDIDEDDYIDLKSKVRSIEELAEFILDYGLHEEFYLEEEDKEFYEWILVDGWLAEMLERKGESILSLYGCKWWGRDSYGQMYENDDVIQKIAKEC